MLSNAIPDCQEHAVSDDIGDLIISGAYEPGLITRKSVNSLLSVTGIADEITRGLGESSDQRSVFLVSILADDSGSIFSRANNAALVAEGHNDIIDELKKVASNNTEDDILLSTRYLSGKILNPYRSLDRAALMNTHSYQEGGGTPLYDQSVITLGTVIAKTAQLAATGAKVRTFTLIITDGADRHSRPCTAQSVAWIAGDMLLTGSHIVAAMGVNDGVTKFRKVFPTMGIKPGWVLTADDSREKIRQAFREVTDQLALVAGSESRFADLALGPGPGFA
jgi:hypothetical protein